MKNSFKFFNKIITLLVVMSLSGQSAVLAGSPQQQGQIRVAYNDTTGKVSFIGADPSQPIRIRSAQAQGLSVDSRSRAMISQYAASFGLKNPVTELKLISTDQMDDREVTRYQQVYQGVPIMGGEMIVNATDTAELLSLSGEIAPDLSLDVTPAISPKQAQLNALEAMAKSHQVSKDVLDTTTPELWIYDSRLLEPDGMKATLVWRLEVKSRDNSLLVNEMVLVDAKRGSIVLNIDQIDTSWAMGATHTNVIPTILRQDDPPTETPTEEPVVTETPAPTVEIQATPTPEALASEQPGEVQALATTTYYVDIVTGNDSSSCTSVTAPCQHIQQAINKASNGDTIYVTDGLYQISSSIFIGKGLTISGGWDITFTNQTGSSVLDGQNTTRVVSIGSNNVVTLDRLSIINGYTTSDGGGIGVIHGTIIINNSLIKGNKANSGGGIFLPITTLTANITRIYLKNGFGQK